MRKKFAEINELIAEPRILEQLKLYLKGAGEADFGTLLESFKKLDEILSKIKASQIDEVIKRYDTAKKNIMEVVDILRPYIELYNDSSIMALINLTNESLSFSFHQDNFLEIPSWVTGAAEIASVVLSTPVALVDLFFEMPFAVMTLMFGNDDYDMFTS